MPFSALTRLAGAPWGGAQAFIWHNKTNEYIGTFYTAEEAAAAYDARARDVFGPDAPNLNWQTAAEAQDAVASVVAENTERPPIIKKRRRNAKDLVAAEEDGGDVDDKANNNAGGGGDGGEQQQQQQ